MKPTGTRTMLLGPTTMLPILRTKETRLPLIGREELQVERGVVTTDLQ